MFKNFWKSKNIFEKDIIKILVTDSGIGGISVAFDLYNFFQKNKYYKRVEIIYADSRENKKSGYNAIDNKDEKVFIFSERLFYLKEVIKPDIIFVACNTLSILLNKTDFYKECDIPIIDILQPSLNPMIKVLTENKHLFILGTNTTINENYYKKTLINYGFDEDNITNQLCPNLAKYIESSVIAPYYLTDNIKWLANRIVQKKPEEVKDFAVSFNCTHYYYVIEQFKKEFNKIKYDPVIVCPNDDMITSFTKYIMVRNYNCCELEFYIFESFLNKSQKNKVENFLNLKFFDFNV